MDLVVTAYLKNKKDEITEKTQTETGEVKPKELKFVQRNG